MRHQVATSAFTGFNNNNSLQPPPQCGEYSVMQNEPDSTQQHNTLQQLHLGPHQLAWLVLALKPSCVCRSLLGSRHTASIGELYWRALQQQEQ